MRSKGPHRTFLHERHSDLRPQGARRYRLARALADRRPDPVLTHRQREVAALLVGTGLSYKQIAAQLGLSLGTVRTHTERIYRAFKVHSRPELTVALRAPDTAIPAAHRH